MSDRRRSVSYAMAGSLGVHAAVLVAIALVSPRAVPAPRPEYVEVTVASLPSQPPKLEPPPAPAAVEAPRPPVQRTTAPQPRPRPARVPSPRSPATLDEVAQPPTVVPTEATPDPAAAVQAVNEPVAEAVASGATGGAATPNTNAGRSSGAASPTASGPYSEGDVDERPRLVHEVQPAYPADALRFGVEGDVVLALVVDAAGQVTDARVTRSAGHGFDESALRVARMLRFTPGRRHGIAVPVRIRWTCRFRLEE